MWYYDGFVKTCRQFEYGGCEGNENKFNTESECQEACVNKKYGELKGAQKKSSRMYDHKIAIPSQCLKDVDSGGCCGIVKNHFKRGRLHYYYDYWRKECLLFCYVMYWGCNGNSNRFKTKKQCERTCMKNRISNLKSGCPSCDFKSGYCVEQQNGTFAHVCKKGFIKDSNDQCIDENECDTETHNCSQFAFCENLVGVSMLVSKWISRRWPQMHTYCSRYTANMVITYDKINNIDDQYRCMDGFMGDGFHCEDIDECAESVSLCSVHALCYNTPGSFYCLCETGYAGNGFICTKSEAVCREYFDDGYRKSCGQGKWQERYFYDLSIKKCVRFWFDMCKGSGRNIFPDIQTCQMICEKQRFQISEMTTSIPIEPVSIQTAKEPLTVGPIDLGIIAKLISSSNMKDDPIKKGEMTDAIEDRAEWKMENGEWKFESIMEMNINQLDKYARLLEELNELVMKQIRTKLEVDEV